jgi:carboxyl-terminal processing protease
MAPGLLAAKTADRYAETNAGWDRFGAVYARVVDSYYDSLSQAQLLQAAIHGVLGELDSYSQYYDREGLRQLRQDTTGKFAGLGITVAVKDSYPIVIAPIEGTPADRAGLLPGDLIVSVENQDTFGMSLDAVVGILRGEPGTTVSIGVAHKRGQPSRRVAIRREVIKIRSVALVERIDPAIGYISMRQTRFSEDTATEVQNGLQDLTALGVTSLILDLRGNPGGLLGQAQQVADLFLPKGVPIVSVRERDGRREDTKYSLKNPIAVDTPLVILIDEGSASAAEIVAGAVQDNDRGIIVGNTSFGKGSVQTIFDLYEANDSALKLTTALYYTPSGRSIHRPGAAPAMRRVNLRQIGGLNLPAEPVVNSLLGAESRPAAVAALRVALDVDQGQAERILAEPLGALIGPLEGATADSSATPVNEDRYFRTRSGRKVFGAGGITPDIIVQRDAWPGFARHLERSRLFFDFIVDQVPADSISALRARGYAVNGDMVAAFRRFIESSEYARDGRLRAAAELEELRQIAVQMGWTVETLEGINRLESVIGQEDESGFAVELDPYIRAALERELSLRLSGRRAQLRSALESDPQLKAAIEILGDPNRYSKILQGTT